MYYYVLIILNGRTENKEQFIFKTNARNIKKINMHTYYVS